MGELKSCPFCGKSVAIIDNCKDLEECANFEECTDDGYVSIVCSVNKGWCGASSGYSLYKEEAEQKWNTRCNEWIPVEDGLPKKDGWVLTTIEFEASENETQSYVMDLYFYSHNKTFVDNRRGKKSPMFDRTTQVIAWKNMPETYEKSSLSSNSDRNGGQ